MLILNSKTVNDGVFSLSFCQRDRLRKFIQSFVKNLGREWEWVQPIVAGVSHQA